MPTIMFDDGFSKLEKTILAKTFLANAKMLDLHKNDFSVHVKKVVIKGGPKHYARVAHLAKDFFLVEINSNGFNLFDATSALGHEAVHMKQYVSEALKDDHEGSYWKDNFFSHLIVALSGNDVPWEQEAWELQGKLHKHAVESLNPEHRKHIDRKQSHGLDRLW